MALGALLIGWYRAERPVGSWLTEISVLAFLISIVMHVVARRSLLYYGPERGYTEAMRSAVDEYDAASVAVLSVQLYDAFPFISAANLQAVAPFPHLWWIQTFYTGKGPSPGTHSGRSPNEMTSTERAAYARSVAGIASAAPDIVVLERFESNRDRSGTRGVDLASYFCQSPSFRAAVGAYSAVETLGPVRLFVRPGVASERKGLTVDQGNEHEHLCSP